MNNMEELKLLLNCDNLSENWNLFYGITKTKNDALTKISDKPHPDSFYNPNPNSAETALTLFMLGNVDCWYQIGRLNILPRKKNEKSSWNEDFFNAMQNNQNIYNNNSKTDIFWKELLKEKIENNNINFKKSILLFEFEIMNEAFHSIGNGAYKELSFIDINKKTEWSQFDAVLIIPSNKLFVFFEAKLKGYKDDFIKQHTDKPPQILRNLESAYLLTNHEESCYNNWDFIYVFISPMDSRWEDSYYSMLNNTGSKYEEILDEMQKSSNFEKYFESFKNDISNHIVKIHWGELGDILTSNDPGFFKNYFNNLSKVECIKPEHIENIKQRFTLARIEWQYVKSAV